MFMQVFLGKRSDQNSACVQFFSFSFRPQFIFYGLPYLAQLYPLIYTASRKVRIKTNGFFKNNGSSETMNSHLQSVTKNLKQESKRNELKNKRIYKSEQEQNKKRRSENNLSASQECFLELFRHSFFVARYFFSIFIGLPQPFACIFQFYFLFVFYLPFQSCNMLSFIKNKKNNNKKHTILSLLKYFLILPQCSSHKMTSQL